MLVIGEYNVLAAPAAAELGRSAAEGGGVANCISPKPAWFSNDKERDYWHMSQDIAFRAGISLVERDGASWVVADDGARLVCGPGERLWFQTWQVLHAEYPKLSRSWVGGRPLSKPGE